MDPFVGTRGERKPSSNDTHLTRRDVLALAAFGLVAGPHRVARAAGPEGELTWGVHVSLAPTW